jgi:hypothetical protein
MVDRGLEGGPRRRVLTGHRVATALVPCGIFIFTGAGMALNPDKSRRHLRWTVENDKGAGSTVDPELKGMFRRIAAQYRDLALQIENLEQWRAKLIASDQAKSQMRFRLQTSELRAAIDVNGIAGDPPGIVGCQEGDNATDVVGLRNALERLHPKDELASGRRLGEG